MSSDAEILKNQHSHLLLQLHECQRDYDKMLETSKHNGDTLKEIRRDINNIRQQQQQTMVERQQQMINLQNNMIYFQNNMIYFQNKMNKNTLELQNKLNNLRN
jgi:hypothetical protein